MQVALPAVPVVITAHGVFDVEFTIVFAARNGGLYLIRKCARRVH